MVAMMPQAAIRWTVFKGMMLPAWFNVRSNCPSNSMRYSGDVEELRAACRCISQIVEGQIAAGLQPKNIFLGGFSQGGAVALLTAKHFLKQQIGGVIGCSAWLPLVDLAFHEKGIAMRAPRLSENLDTPVFMAIGDLDTTVPTFMQCVTAAAIRDQGAEVTEKHYDCAHYGTQQAFVFKDIAEWIVRVYQKERPQVTPLLSSQHPPLGHVYYDEDGKQTSIQGRIHACTSSSSIEPQIHLFLSSYLNQSGRDLHSQEMGLGVEARQMLPLLQLWLQSAIKLDLTEMIASLLEVGTWTHQGFLDSPLQQCTGRSALHLACMQGRDTIVMQLVDYGANSNVQDKLGYSPLHLALQSHSACAYTIAAKLAIDSSTFKPSGAEVEELIQFAHQNEWLVERLDQAHSGYHSGEMTTHGTNRANGLVSAVVDRTGAGSGGRALAKLLSYRQSEMEKGSCPALRKTFVYEGVFSPSLAFPVVFPIACAVGLRLVAAYTAVSVQMAVVTFATAACAAYVALRSSPPAFATADSDSTATTGGIHVNSGGSEPSCPAPHLRYCVTCKLCRPVRSKHCNDCKKCVLQQDHHCIWAAMCVGKGNTLPFIVFVISFATSCAVNCFALLCAIVQVHGRPPAPHTTEHAGAADWIWASAAGWFWEHSRYSVLIVLLLVSALLFETASRTAVRTLSCWGVGLTTNEVQKLRSQAGPWDLFDTSRTNSVPAVGKRTFSLTDLLTIYYFQGLCTPWQEPLRPTMSGSFEADSAYYYLKGADGKLANPLDGGGLLCNIASSMGLEATS
jgi:predicted esterase